MMKKAVFLKKLSMTSIIDESGVVYPATMLKFVEQEIVEIKNKEKHGYNSLLYAYEDIKEKKLNKPKLGFFKKRKKSVKKYLKEIRLSDSSYDEIVQLENNDDIHQKYTSLSTFEEKDIVSVRGKSKGKGFQGTIKVHNFHRGPMSHGSKNHRLPGSIGAGTDPARVFKGTKMAKRLGFKNVTVKNLVILKIDLDNNYVFIKGAVPGKASDLILMYK